MSGLPTAKAMYLCDWPGKTVDIPFDEDLYYEELMKRIASYDAELTSHRHWF